MNPKTNKELALETAIEYTKSWNSADRTQAVKTNEFIDILNAVYDAICALDKR